ncbi:substrate-binding domain-containing protein [Streptomyces iranensis]|uniref:substrate-binding domain-containing protein n=1 Tax=Streptomyces iranensis TaxID=576784 RepID=UPI0039B79352
MGVVIPDMSNRFFSAALQSIARTIRQHGYELLVSSTEGEPTLERRSVEVLATKRVDGLIVAPVGGTDTHHLRQLAESGTALVLLDRPAPKITGASFVSVNNIEASRLAVNHLIGLGHRHIGIHQRGAVRRHVGRGRGSRPHRRPAQHPAARCPVRRRVRGPAAARRRRKTSPRLDITQVADPSHGPPAVSSCCSVAVATGSMRRT